MHPVVCQVYTDSYLQENSRLVILVIKGKSNVITLSRLAPSVSSFTRSVHTLWQPHQRKLRAEGEITFFFCLPGIILAIVFL